MSNELIIATVASENLAFSAIHIRKDGGSVPLHTVYDRNEAYRLMRDPEELLRRHPDAHYSIEVPLDGVWSPPAEPHRKKPRWIPAHTKAMRESLTAYLNERLAGLDEMVRTGSWVLWKARVRGVSCRPIPEKVWRGEDPGWRDREAGKVAKRRAPNERKQRKR